MYAQMTAGDGISSLKRDFSDLEASVESSSGCESVSDVRKSVRASVLRARSHFHCSLAFARMVAERLLFGSSKTKS